MYKGWVDVVSAVNPLSVKSDKIYLAGGDVDGNEYKSIKDMIKCFYNGSTSCKNSRRVNHIHTIMKNIIELGEVDDGLIKTAFKGVLTCDCANGPSYLPKIEQ
jgi:hypothetical protein